MTNKEEYLKKINEDPKKSFSLKDLSKLSGVELDILEEVYKRGVGAWVNNPASVRLKGSFRKNRDLKRYPRNKRLGKEQWGYGRVYSFLNKSTTYKTTDSDLAKKANY